MSQIFPNWLNQHWILSCHTVLERIQLVDKIATNAAQTVAKIKTLKYKETYYIQAGAELLLSLNASEVSELL